MTAQSTDPLKTASLRGTPQWRLSLPLFTILMVALLAGVLFAYARPAEARILLPAAVLSALGLAVTWRWPLVPLGLMLAFIPLYDGIVRYLTHVLELPATWLQC